MPEVVAIILAAGESTRMGAAKALLADPDGRPFVARLVRTFHAADVRDVIVVTGSRHDDIAAALERDAPLVSPTLARNEAPSRGQLSSLWTGLSAAERLDPAAALVTLVDVPMVRESTVRAVVERWRRARPPVVRPAIGDRHGHPVLFDRSLFEELRRAPLAEGAKVVVHRHAATLVNVEVDDPGCVIDVDTRDDYERLLRPPRS
jgi:molybdenum cofactor cytidylyltransferase